MTVTSYHSDGPALVSGKKNVLYWGLAALILKK